MDSFFLVEDQSYIEISNNQDTAQSETFKDPGKDIAVDISVEIPKTKNSNKTRQNR